MTGKNLLALLKTRRTRQEIAGLRESAIMLPGSFNGLVGRLVSEEGFQATYISGAAVSASKGLPDVGLTTLNEFCEVIRDVSRASGLPVLVDADTGFGGAEMICRTVYEYYQSGASGCHIEDQRFPKRCGHLDGKELIPTSEMAEKIRWARQTSDQYCNGDFLICGRTDARGVTGIEDAINRSVEYVAAGAHMIFPEGLTTISEFELFATKLQAKCPQQPYLLANMTEFGKSPQLTAKELGALGYDVVIFPVSSLRTAIFAVKDLLSSIHTNGGVTLDSLNKMQTRQELYKSLQYVPGQHWSYPKPSRSNEEN